MFEGEWNCAQCLKEGIPGGETKCPLCESPRDQMLDPSERAYLPGDAQAITDPEELRDADSGPNWNCGKCGTANLGTAKVCGECQEPRDWDDTVNPVYEFVEGDPEGVTPSNPSQLETDWVDAIHERGDNLRPLADGPVEMPTRTLPMSDLPREGQSPYKKERPQDTVRPRDGGKIAVLKWRPAAPRGLVKIVLIGVLASLVLFGLVRGGEWVYANHIKTQTVELTIRGLWWERSVEVEERRTFTKEGWEIPPGGRTVSSREKIKSYKQVFDHYEKKTRKATRREKTGTHDEKYNCKIVEKGNGYFEEKCLTKKVDDYTMVPYEEEYEEAVYRNDPVYATWYTYLLDQWVTDRTDRASGQSNPYWPEPRLSGHKERIGSRFELYRVTLVDAKGRTSEATANEATWSRLVEGQRVSGEQTRKGDVREVHWP